MSAPSHDKARALRKMKLIATAAFVLMTVLFIVSHRLGAGTIFWVVRWDHLAAFAEASMVGALADWFAVVALFKHPLGIPIWHTAIIPKSKDEISRSIRTFVETRLLSVENVSAEIERFSASAAIAGFLETEQNRDRVAGWLAEALGAIVRGLDDESVENLIRENLAARLSDFNAAALLGDGLEMLVESGKHEQFLDQALRYVAGIVPEHRLTIKQFIEGAIERTLKWGKSLVPDVAVESVTDNVLASLIDVLSQAAEDPSHPLRADLCGKFEEWTLALQHDPEMQEKLNRWKNDLVGNPRVRGYVSDLWSRLKTWTLEDIRGDNSMVRTYARRAVDAFHTKLRDDPEIQRMLDEKLRAGALSLLQNNHHQIGAIVQRVVDQWDGPRLSRELELSLGRDLQYIRLNGTFIGGLVGLIIHLLL